MNNYKHFYNYNENIIIIKIMVYMFQINENKLLKQNFK